MAGDRRQGEEKRVTFSMVRKSQPLSTMYGATDRHHGNRSQAPPIRKHPREARVDNIKTHKYHVYHFASMPRRGRLGDYRVRGKEVD